MESIIGDQSKFREVVGKDNSKHPVLPKKISVQYYLKEYLKKFIDKDMFKSLIPSGSLPGKLYGLCKVHKENFPMRPVISMVGSAEYKLAKYLDGLIKPFIPGVHMVNSTAEFLDKLKTGELSTK